MIGASGISVLRFTAINFIAAIIWAVGSCYLGYLIGYYFSQEIEATFAFVIRKIYLMGIGLLTLLIGGVIWHFRATRKS